MNTKRSFRQINHQILRTVSAGFILISIIAGCLSVAANTASAATYYVDATNGNDSNSGTSEQPWKTLDRAYTWYPGTGTKVAEGDTVLLRNGNYGIFRENTDDNPWAAYYVERNNWITYKAADGHRPVFSRITVKNENHGTSPFTRGRSYLWFEGITIPAGSINFSKTAFVKVIGCNVTGATTSYEGAYKQYYAADNGNLIAGYDVNDFTIQNCELSLGYRGIHSSGVCERWVIQDCNIHDFGESGISASVSNITITGNKIQHICDSESLTAGGWPLTGTMTNTFTVGEVINQATTDACGIYYRTSGSQYYIYRTSATNFAANYTVTGQESGATLTNTNIGGGIHSNGIYFNKGNNVICTNNYIHTASQGVAFYRYIEPGMTGVEFSNNIIWGSRGNSTVYLHIEGVAEANICNNTVYSTAVLPAYVWVTKLHDANTSITNMYNNIFPKLEGQNTTTRKILNHGNNIFGNNPNGAGYVTDSTDKVNQTLSSGYFTDAASGDFTLLSSSPAVDWGNKTYAPSTDILGNSRVGAPDTGCYEYAPVVLSFAPIGNKEVNEGCDLPPFIVPL
jgi:hypothetical protein